MRSAPSSTRRRDRRVARDAAVEVDLAVDLDRREHAGDRGARHHGRDCAGRARSTVSRPVMTFAVATTCTGSAASSSRVVGEVARDQALEPARVDRCGRAARARRAGRRAARTGTRRSVRSPFQILRSAPHARRGRAGRRRTPRSARRPRSRPRSRGGSPPRRAPASMPTSTAPRLPPPASTKAVRGAPLISDRTPESSAHAHRVVALVDVDRRAGDAARQRGTQKCGGRADLVRVDRLGQRRVPLARTRSSSR